MAGAFAGVTILARMPSGTKRMRLCGFSAACAGVTVKAASAASAMGQCRMGVPP